MQPLSSSHPIWAIFALLSTCRALRSASPRSLRRALAGHGLRLAPSPSFWLRLCRAAALLDEQSPPRPTLLVPQWLAQPLGAQLASLLEAWRRAPASADHRRRRERLLDYLRERSLPDSSNGSRSEPAPILRRELSGLQALGLWEDGALTPIGRAVLSDPDHTLTFPSPERWTLAGFELRVPFPPDWSLLWELEAYLEPIAFGHYLITPAALECAAQRGPLDKLVQLIERGLGRPLPAEVLDQVTNRPAVRLHPGPLLEFADPDELIRLRKSPRLRRHLNHLISPRHVLLDPMSVDQVIGSLRRRGIPACLPSPDSGESRDISDGDRAYLLSLVYIAQELDVPSPPPGLIDKLSSGLAEPLRTAVSRQVTIVLQQLSATLPHILSEDKIPPSPAPDLLETLGRAIQSGEPIDVLYHVPGRPAPERRHLTPLLLETRGPRHYLIAYCHTRRANRTFRLDRLQIADS